MGMYDCINGDQVKIFYTPIFDEVKKNTWRSGGKSISYNTGDTIPSKTLYYKLPKNFLILSGGLDYDDILVHVIEDSKVVETKKLNNLDDSFFSKYETILNSKGTSIKVQSKRNCIDYLNESEKKFQDLTKNAMEISNVLKNNLHPLYTLQRYILEENLHKRETSTNEKLKNIEILLNRNPKIKSDILKMLNINSIYELKHLFIKDNESLEYTENAILSYTKSEINIYNDEIRKLQEEKKPTYEEIIKNYNNRWIKEDNYKKESMLGELIDCFIYSYISKDNGIDNFLGDHFEKYLNVKKTIKELLIQNKDLVNSYCIWQEFSSEERKAIEELLDFILNSKDKDECNEIIRQIYCL